MSSTTSNSSHSTTMQQALSGLQLPQSSVHSPQPTPSICVLAVADIDLASSAALAEYALQMGFSSRVDLCVASGPFCRSSDLKPYLHGRSRQRRRRRKRELAEDEDCRTREETAAMEGLLTGALSQLESIVCRVVFVPGSTDPITTLSSSPYELRLTPNSRNIHRQWLKLAPGLGCTGLLLVNATLAARLSQNQEPTDYDDEEEDEEEEDEEEEDEDNDEDDDLVDRYGVILPPEMQVQKRPSLQKPPPLANVEIESEPHEEEPAEISHDKEFFDTLHRLIQLAPPIVSRTCSRRIIPPPFETANAQTILVTQHPTINDTADDDPLYMEPLDFMPSDSHRFFLDSPEVQELVFLEICAGCSQWRPTHYQQGPVHVVVPGSLRERGEFCLVDVAIHINGTACRWSVRNVEFHTLDTSRK